MKTVTGGVLAAKPISLAKAATLLSSFASSENGASQAVSAYLRRASTAFNELKSLHRDLKSSPVKETHLSYNDSGELDALDRSGRDLSQIKHEVSHKKMDKSTDLMDNGAVNDKKKKKSKKNIEEDEIEKEKTQKKRKGDKEMRSEEKKRKKKSKSKEISS